jgi:GR25 family glycosyltransferase involved in LPS biosynthesis/glycosyltransferase involved in cell wall biosynthesis
MFNLAREICRAEAVDFASCHRDSEANLPLDGPGSRLLVVKSHNPMADLQSLIANSSEPAVITVRDPRDAVVSMLQRFPNSPVTSFEETLNTVAHSAQTLVTLSRLRAMLVFRYEDGFVGSVETFDRIAALLGTTPPQDHREAILAGLTPEAVRRTISDLEAAGAIRGADVWDSATQWHANHVGDGKIGKFGSVLSLEQQREVVRQTREFCECFGYDVTVDETRALPGAVVEARRPVPEQQPATAARRDRAGAKTIGLCMIVRNERHVIRQCLASALPLVDYVLVVDTGSADGTQQVIRDVLAEHGIRGAVIDEPWRDFAYNRTFALERLRAVADVDYAMIIDADDLVVPDAGFDPPAFKARMEHDLYDVEIFHGGVVFHRPQICSNRLAFSFKGVLHEYLEGPPGQLSRTTARGFRIQTSRGGARNRNPRKYQDDAALLERALATETDAFLISRYTFYLAQSYKDCGEREQALANYLKRAELGYWSEEIYVSLLEAANLMAALERPFDAVTATYERAARTVPARAEALHAASLYCRHKGKNAVGQEFARRGLGLAPPVGGLFVQSWVYDYGILDEFAINAYWAGAYRESLDASLQLLAGGRLPADMVKRVAENARYAAEKLPQAKPPELGAPGAESLIDQHRLVAPRPLRSRVRGSPRVLVAILAKQKAAALPLYLECIAALDYPKSSIVLYVRTNNNTDATEHILREWLARVGQLYSAVEFDAADVPEPVQNFAVHEWNATRFRVLGRIRNISLRRALEHDCDFYFVADVDNFIRPCTLRELVALDLPIVAPLLRSIAPGGFYSNYHAEIDANGYFKGCDQYQWILNRWLRGVHEVPVVHCTYLVRADVLNELSYEDATARYEYVVFSDSARKSGVVQYLDNRQVYGYVTFDEGNRMHVLGGIERARALLQRDLRARAGLENDARESMPGPVAPVDRPPPVGLAPEHRGSGHVAGGTGPHLRASPPKPATELPPIHLINLDRSTERLLRFNEYNGHLGNVIRVPAADGSALDREALINSGYITADLPYPAGTLGCALSHLKLWEMAVSQDRSVTIFEDDIVVSHQFEKRARQVLSVVPDDWDIIQWGYVFNPSFIWVDLGVSKAKLEGYGERNYRDSARLRAFQAEQFPVAPVRLLHSFGLQGYSISAKGARAALAYCLPFRKRLIEFPGARVTINDIASDCTLCGLYPELKAYACVPPLLIEIGDDSARKAIDREGENSLVREPALQGCSGDR